MTFTVSALTIEFSPTLYQLQKYYCSLTSSIILVRFTGVVITVAGGVFKNYCFHSRQWSFVTFWLVQHSENHMNCFVLWVSVWDHRRGNVHSQCGCMKGSTEGGICLVCICILASVLYVGRNGVRASDFFCSNINILFFFVACRCFFMRPQWGWWLEPVPQGHTSCWSTTSDAGRTAPTQPVRRGKLIFTQWFKHSHHTHTRVGGHLDYWLRTSSPVVIIV